MALKPLQEEQYDKTNKPSLVDSSKKKLDVGRIAVIAAYETESEQPPNAVAMSILLELQQPNTLFKQFGNTLFIAHPSKEPGKFIFRALNADTVENYLESAKKFIYLMKQQGATELATQFTGEKILRFIKLVAKEMVQEDGAPIGYRAYKRGDEYLVAITLTGVSK